MNGRIDMALCRMLCSFIFFALIYVFTNHFIFFPGSLDEPEDENMSPLRGFAYLFIGFAFYRNCIPSGF